MKNNCGWEDWANVRSPTSLSKYVCQNDAVNKYNFESFNSIKFFWISKINC